jgi:predicted small secreted protein
MKRLIYMALLLTSVTVAGCSKNYYSGSGKSNKGCGCPAQKGL